MSAENEKTISRRQLFGRLLGRGPSEPPGPAADETQTEPPESLVEKYLAVLDRQRDALAFGVADGELPDTREAIKAAVVAALPVDAQPGLREILRDAYASLAWFTAGEELEHMLAGKRALERVDQSEDGKKAVITAFTIRGGKIREMTALGKEFDERTAARDATGDGG